MLELTSSIIIRIPTIIFSEVVLSYINPESIPEIEKIIAAHFDEVVYLNYEVLNSSDRFGKKMIENFQNYGIPLKGIISYPNVLSIRNRLNQNGFSKVDINNMKNIYHFGINADKRKEIDSIEWLDEYEEFDLIQEHYFLAVSSKSLSNSDNITGIGLNALK